MVGARAGGVGKQARAALTSDLQLPVADEQGGGTWAAAKPQSLAKGC